MMSMVMAPVTKSFKGLAFHHHGAIQGIDDPTAFGIPYGQVSGENKYCERAARSPLRWRPTLNGGADVPPLPAFETAIRKAGFFIVVS
jgi:hypothetical protein